MLTGAPGQGTAMQDEPDEHTRILDWITALRLALAPRTVEAQAAVLLAVAAALVQASAHALAARAGTDRLVSLLAIAAELDRFAEGHRGTRPH